MVDIDDVRDYLPADMPVVTPAERAADLQERLLGYFYVQHQDYGPGWVTANLEYDQIKAAVGAEQFHDIFGSQQDVPSVIDRLTSPALSPDWDTVGQEFLANPGGSLSAIVNNLALAVKDVELPAVLAVLRMEVLVGQTLQAVNADISAGQLSQLMTDLGTGVQGLETVFNDTLTDPATSVAAGILNARDDLAVAIMNADGYALSSSDFTSAWSELSGFSDSVSQMLTAGSDYLAGLI